VCVKTERSWGRGEGYVSACCRKVTGLVPHSTGSNRHSRSALLHASSRQKQPAPQFALCCAGPPSFPWGPVPLTRRSLPEAEVPVVRRTWAGTRGRPGGGGGRGNRQERRGGAGGEGGEVEGSEPGASARKRVERVGCLVGR
jgi:hypothetical protein